MFWSFGKSKKISSKGLVLNLSKGFTLLELIVVIAIFLIITVVVIADIPNFREKSSLDLTISEVATYIRGAQVYGAAQKGGVSPYYLIHLTKNQPDFCLLSSVKQNCSPGGYEEKYTINGFTVSDILIDGSPLGGSTIDIVFSSNNYSISIGTKLEPAIYYNYFSLPSPISFNTLDVKITSIRNSSNYSCIRVYNNGQITPLKC